MARILIVEDERMINELILRNLQAVGHTCVQVYDGQEALQKINSAQFDLVILDVMLPSMSGFEVMEQIKQTPVIFLTSKGNVVDKIHGLRLGAEDYMVKPFEMLELIARVDVVLRRRKKKDDVFCLGDVTVNLETLQVTKSGVPVELAPQELQLLEVLVRNRNIALPREKLLDLAWGFDYLGDIRTVDVHIQKLRKKLDWTPYIKTVYKLGYRLELPPEAPE